jgi:serine/threonine protein kinase
MNGADLRPQFGIETTWQFGQTVSLFDQLPVQQITGLIRTKSGAPRCTIAYLNVINQGGYGKIQRVKRTDPSGESVIVVAKIPILECHKQSFAQEALVQHFAKKSLDRYGFRGAVAEVYDIYNYIDECRFTMEFIDGQSALETVYRASDPGLAFLHVLSQLCMILLVLETTMNLDHRDLKITNLWVRKVPVTYRIEIGKSVYTVYSPFQIVLLDFGFACIGQELNLGDGVFPDLDPCPKEGRDIFQFLVSLWSVEAVRSKLPAEIQGAVNSWLDIHAEKAKRFQKGLGWTYAVTGDPTFRSSILHPAVILAQIGQKWPGIVDLRYSGVP